MAGPWTAAEATSDAVSKKMLLAHMQENCSAEFLSEHKLTGQANSVLKRVTKDAMVAAYTVSLGEGGAKKGGAPKAAFTFSPPAAGENAAIGAKAATGNLFGQAPAAQSTGAFAFNFGAKAGGDDEDDEDDEDDDEDDDFQPGKGQKNIGKMLQQRMQRLNMSAAQRRDQTMSELPPAVRDRVVQLEKLQESTDKLQKEFDEKLKALQLEYEGKYAPLYRERSVVVKGDASSDAAGVPGFWLQALQNNVMLAEEVQKHDEPILAYLLDLKSSTQLGGGKQGFQLAFVFAENPYFTDKVLTKTYLMDPEDEDECLERAVGCDIHWKQGKDVTVKTVQKKQKKKGKTRTVQVEEPTDSFFQFFDPPEPPEEEMEEEDMEQLQEELEHDYEVGCLIKDKVVPRAVSWFTGAAIDPEEEYDEEDDDEDDEEDDEDEDEDDDDDDDEDDESDDEDAIDTSKPKKLATGKPNQGGPVGPDGEQAECKQQ